MLPLWTAYWWLYTSRVYILPECTFHWLAFIYRCITPRRRQPITWLSWQGFYRSLLPAMIDKMANWTSQEELWGLYRRIQTDFTECLAFSIQRQESWWSKFDIYVVTFSWIVKDSRLMCSKIMNAGALLLCPAFGRSFPFFAVVAVMSSPSIDLSVF